MAWKWTERVGSRGPGFRFIVHASRTFKATFDWLMWLVALLTALLALFVGFEHGLGWALTIVFGVIAAVLFLAGREATAEVIRFEHARASSVFDVRLSTEVGESQPVSTADPPAEPAFEIFLTATKRGIDEIVTISVERVEGVSLPPGERSWEFAQYRLRNAPSERSDRFAVAYPYPPINPRKSENRPAGCYDFLDRRQSRSRHHFIQVPGVRIDENGQPIHESMVTPSSVLCLVVRVSGVSESAWWRLGFGFDWEELNRALQPRSIGRPGRYRPRLIQPVKLDGPPDPGTSSDEP